MADGNDQTQFIENAAKQTKNLLLQIKDLKFDEAKKGISAKAKSLLEEISKNYLEVEKINRQHLFGDELTKIEAGFVLVSCFNVLTENGQRFPLEGYQSLETLSLNLSNCSEDFCKQICKAGIVSLVGRILEKFKNDFASILENSDFVESALKILFNCARIDDNKPYFQAQNSFIDVLVWIAKNTPTNVGISSACARLLLEISQEEEIGDIITNQDIIKQIVNYLGIAVLAEDDKCTAESSSTNLTRTILKLIDHEKNSEVLLQLGILEHFCKMLKTGNEDKKIVAVEALGMLAFKDKNKKVLLENDELIHLLKGLASSSVNSRELKRAAKSVLWVLRNFSTDKKETSSEVDLEVVLADAHPSLSFMDERAPFANHIMISYQWNYQDVMVKVAKRLRAHGYKVWIDVDDMKGDILEAMAKAVEGAVVVLVSMAKKYQESFNCRTEAEYAYALRKTIIPLKVESHYKPHGWLGALLGTKLYFDFSDPKNFNKSFKNLIKEIGSRGKANNGSSSHNNSSEEEPEGSQSNVQSWTNKEVIKWARKNKVGNLASTSIDGEVLLFLKQMQEKSPDFYYRCITEKLELQDIRDMMFFTQALTKLE